MDDIRLQLNDLTQMELDQLFYALLNAFCGVRHELRSNTEHTWGSLLIVQQGLADFSLEVVREAAHVMLLVGFLKSLDDRVNPKFCVNSELWCKTEQNIHGRQRFQPLSPCL